MLALPCKLQVRWSDGLTGLQSPVSLDLLCRWQEATLQSENFEKIANKFDHKTTLCDNEWRDSHKEDKSQ